MKSLIKKCEQEKKNINVWILRDSGTKWLKKKKEEQPEKEKE